MGECRSCVVCGAKTPVMFLRVRHARGKLLLIGGGSIAFGRADKRTAMLCAHDFVTWWKSDLAQVWLYEAHGVVRTILSREAFAFLARDQRTTPRQLKKRFVRKQEQLHRADKRLKDKHDAAAIRVRQRWFKDNPWSLWALGGATTMLAVLGYVHNHIKKVAA